MIKLECDMINLEHNMLMTLNLHHLVES